MYAVISAQIGRVSKQNHGPILTGLAEDFQDDRQEHIKFGGPRFCTFMIYLSDVESGGRTVFPTIGVSVPPIAGSALFWMNLDSGGLCRELGIEIKAQISSPGFAYLFLPGSATSYGR